MPYEFMEGDGPTDELYFLLWSKNPATRRGPAVFVPDTVIYKCGSPCAKSRWVSLITSA